MKKGLGCFKFSASGFCVVEVCHGRQNDEDFYTVLAIEPENYRYFKKRYRPGESLNLRAFGYELVRGPGKEPAPHIIEKLEKVHGIEFGVSESFLNRMIANLEPKSMPLTRDYYANLAFA
jgi:hypothetical protein